MSADDLFSNQDPGLIRRMLRDSGYSDKAIDYYFQKPFMGSLDQANQVTQLTGACGDTMKLYLRIDANDRIQDARIQVLGCPAAVASAMATMEMIRGKTVAEAAAIRDGEVFQVLEALPDQKQHCIRLTIKTLGQALEEYQASPGRSLAEG